jgi:magnesium-transporting ATPase (P-type)
MMVTGDYELTAAAIASQIGIVLLPMHILVEVI